jgi:c-di-AMP phosphodiesterase-like protein
MLVSLFESLEQGMIDESIATALYTGITSATHNFTTPSTSAKSMTVAAQMLAAGAKQQEIVKVMNAKPKNEQAKPEPKVPDAAAPTSMKEAMAQAKKEVVKEESASEGSKKKTESGLGANSNPKTSSQDHSKAESTKA